VVRPSLRSPGAKRREIAYMYLVIVCRKLVLPSHVDQHYHFDMSACDAWEHDGCMRYTMLTSSSEVKVALVRVEQTQDSN